jgi:VWFA-related protein
VSRHPASRRCKCGLALSGALLLLVCDALPAQQALAPDDTLELTVDVRVVSVDAVVLDRRGRPVRGLKASDFKLFEDGKPVEIEHFASPEDLVREEETRREPAPSGAATMGAPVPRAGSLAGPSTLVFLLDERLLPPSSRRRIVDGLAAQLQEIQRYAGRLVFARHREELELIEPATADRILETVNTEAAPGAAVIRGGELSRVVHSMVASHEACENAPRCVPCSEQEGNWHELLQLARNHVSAEQERLGLALDVLAELISWLAGLDGEKLLIYPSDGLPQQPGLEAHTFIIDLCAPLRDGVERDISSEIFQYDESRRLRTLGAWANARGVRLFPLDAVGLRGGMSNSVEFGRVDVRPSARLDSVAKSNAEGGLHQLADETGGRAVFNSNTPLADLDLEREVAGRYSLGYVPARPPTGRRHELRVELASGRGLEIRHRRSFLDRTLEQRLVDELQTALRLDLKRADLHARLAFGDVTRDPEWAGLYRVPVKLILPASRLEMIDSSQDGSQPHGRIRIWLGALRDDGTPTELRQELFTLGEGGLQPHDGMYEITVTVPLKPGSWTVAVGARDEVAQRTSLLRGAIVVDDEFEEEEEIR